MSCCASSASSCPPTPSSATACSGRRSCGHSSREDHEQRELLVADEAVLRARLDEDGGALLHGDPLALHLEYAAPLEHDVDLVVLVRLLAVRLRRDEHV